MVGTRLGFLSFPYNLNSNWHALMLGFLQEKEHRIVDRNTPVFVPE